MPKLNFRKYDARKISETRVLHNTGIYWETLVIIIIIIVIIIIIINWLRVKSRIFVKLRV